MDQVTSRPRRNALIVHAHSEADSFVAAMRDRCVAVLERENWDVIQSDLYAMQFDPVLSPQDFGTRSNTDHLTYALEQRTAFAQGTLAADITDEVHKVLAADLLIFTFPLFFGSASLPY